LGTYGQADEVIAADEHRRRGSLMRNHPQLQAFVSQQSTEPQAVAEEEESKEAEEEHESLMVEEPVVVAMPKPVMVS